MNSRNLNMWPSLQTLPKALEWAEGQAWVEAMRQCQQNPEWHAEGDVWTHTKMVCNQLPLLEGWDSLTQEEQSILIFTALLHDSAKPLTSRLEEGVIRSPKHALKGEHLAREILRDIGCPLGVREKIARMVRFHGRPAFLLEKERPENEVAALSWLVTNKLLYFFALADNRGRDTDTGRSEDNLHLWKLVAEEIECFEQPYPFANDHARFVFYRKEDLYYVPHEEYRCTVTMLSGLPGAGKDTWWKKNRQFVTDELIFSLDDARDELDVEPTDNQGQVVQYLQERMKEQLRAKKDFTFNATNLTRQVRQRWINLFDNYNARIEIVYIEPEMNTILAQNRNRGTDFVPEKVIWGLASKMEPPTWTECHLLTVVG